jgi:hypothetical protein
MFVEQNCTIEHNGRTFEAGGAVITENRIVAYLGKNGVLTDWRGNAIGSYRIVSTWVTSRSYRTEMNAVHARVDGKLFKGRSAGEGMVFIGKLSKA